MKPPRVEGPVADVVELIGELAERHGEATMHAILERELGPAWSPDQLFLLACVGEWSAQRIADSPGAPLTERGRAGAAWAEGFLVGWAYAQRKSRG